MGSNGQAGIQPQHTLLGDFGEIAGEWVSQPPLWRNEGVYLTRGLVFQNLVYLMQLVCKCSVKKGEFSLEGERKTPSLKINVSGRAEGLVAGVHTPWACPTS